MNSSIFTKPLYFFFFCILPVISRLKHCGTKKNKRGHTIHIKNMNSLLIKAQSVCTSVSLSLILSPSQCKNQLEGFFHHHQANMPYYPILHSYPKKLQKNKLGWNMTC